MKIFLFIAAILFSNIVTPRHDVPLAIFHITASDGFLKMDIVFDLEDFTESLDIETSEVNLKNVQNYLTKNTSFQFNAQVAKLKISEVKIVRDHIRIKGNFGKPELMIKNIKVENTCLNNVRRHSNVIQIDLNNKSKDYRMHERRTVIELEY